MPADATTLFRAGEPAAAGLASHLAGHVARGGTAAPGPAGGAALHAALAADPALAATFAAIGADNFARGLHGHQVLSVQPPAGQAALGCVALETPSGALLLAFGTADPSAGPGRLFAAAIAAGAARPDLPPAGSPFADAATAAAARAVVQATFQAAEAFAQAAMAQRPGAEVLLAGFGDGGYAALFLHHTLGADRACVFEAPNGGLFRHLNPAGGPPAEGVLEVRALTADAAQTVGEASGRVLHVDADSFGVTVPSALGDTVFRGTRVDRALSGKFGPGVPDTTVPALLRVGLDAAGGALPGGHPRHDLARLVAGHAAQVAGAGAAMVLVRLADGTVRVDFPTAAGPDGIPPSYSLALPDAGAPRLVPTPRRVLHLDPAGPAIGGHATPLLVSLPVEEEAYAEGVAVDPATGAIPAQGALTLAGLLALVHGGAPLPIPVPAAETLEAVLARAVMLAGPEAAERMPAEALRSALTAGGTLGRYLDADGAAAAALDGLAAEVAGGVVARIGASLGIGAEAGLAGVLHGTALAGTAVLAAAAALGRLADVPGGWGPAGEAVQRAAVLAAGGRVAGMLGAGAPLDLAAAFELAREAAELPGQPGIRLADTWRAADPFAPTAGTAAAVLAQALAARDPAGAATGAAVAPALLDLDRTLGTPAAATVPLLAEAGRIVAGAGTVERDGYEGPAPRVLLPAWLMAQTAAAVLDAAFRTAGATVSALPGVSVRVHAADGSVAVAAGGTECLFAHAAREQALKDLLSRALAAAVPATGPGTDTVLLRLLGLGWYEWVAEAADPDARALLPGPEWLDTRDAAAAALAALGAPAPARPGRGGPKEYLVASLETARAVLPQVRAHLEQAFAGTPPASFPAFERMAEMIGALRTEGASAGVAVPALPAAAAHDALLPADDPIRQKPVLLEMVLRILGWLHEAAALTPEAIGAVIKPRPVQGLTVRAEDLLQADGTVQPVLRVEWLPLGPGESLALRWQALGETAWQGRTVPPGTSATYLHPVQHGKTYRVQAARQAGTRQSDWSPVLLVVAGTGLGEAGVSHLELVGRGLETEFAGRDVRLQWRGNFPGSAYELGSEPFGAGSGVVNPYLKDYVVRVHDPESGALLREAFTTGTSWTYGYEANVEDGGPRRQVRVTVAVRDKLGKEGRPATITVRNPVPAAPAATVRSGYRQIFIELPPASDLDFRSNLVWVEPAAGFDPAATPPRLETVQNSIVIPEVEEGTYHVRVARTDAFGSDGLEVSAEYPVEVVDNLVDLVPPDMPTGLVLSTSHRLMPTGQADIRVRAAWDASDAPDFDHYVADIREGAGEWFSYVTDAPTFEWSVLPDTAYSVRVRAVDHAANQSDPCVPATITSARDDVAPGPVTGLVHESSLRTLFLRWTNPPDSDLDHVEVWEAPVNDRSSATVVARPKGDHVTIHGLPPAALRYYWLRARDTSSNAGPFSSADNAGYQVTMARAVADDLADAAVTAQKMADNAITLTKFASGLRPVEVAATLPASGTEGAVVLLTTDGKLYRRHGGAWVASVPAGDLVGQITGTQIAPGSITTPKLAANAVTANEIAAGSIVAGKLAADAVTAGTIAAGAVNAGQIAANAIRANHILAGEIVAGKLAVGSIDDATLIEDGVIVTRHVTVGSLNGDRITAGTLNADRITAGSITGDRIDTGTSLPGTIKVGNTGVTISTVQANASLGAQDPASRINANSTQIDPGRVLISGGSTLASWRDGNNLTQINGGAISANSITANKLKIGNRNVTFDGLYFRTNGSNVMSWQTGSVHYIDDNGNNKVVTIADGSITGSGYVYWIKDETFLRTTPTVGPHLGEDRIHIATYLGSDTKIVHYGGTIIEGNEIRTGTVRADHIVAQGLQADIITSGTFNPVRIPNLDASKITTGTLSASRIDTANLYVNAANVTGLLQAGQINVNSINISAAQITNGTLASARIADLSIDTLKIKGQAVTTDKLGANAVSHSVYVNADGETVTGSVAVSETFGKARLIVFASGWAIAPEGNSICTCTLYSGLTAVEEKGVWHATMPCFFHSFEVEAGTHPFKFQMERGSGARLVIFVLKR